MAKMNWEKNTRNRLVSKGRGGRIAGSNKWTGKATMVRKKWTHAELIAWQKEMKSVRKRIRGEDVTKEINQSSNNYWCDWMKD